MLRSPAALLTVPSVPAGLPSGVLERRPDVRQVEKALAAASLRIDRARADYFPSVSLNATFFIGAVIMLIVFAIHFSIRRGVVLQGVNRGVVTHAQIIRLNCQFLRIARREQ